MKKLILLSFLFAQTAFASEIQMLEGDAAYKLYLSLPGVRCTEWNSPDYVVYTKYQTQACDGNSENDQWTCTIQMNKMDPAKAPFISASCTREIP